MKKIMLLSLLVLALSTAFTTSNAPSLIQGQWELNSVFQGQPFSFLVLFKANGNYDGFLNKKAFVSGKYQLKYDTLYIADRSATVIIKAPTRFNFSLRIRSSSTLLRIPARAVEKA